MSDYTIKVLELLGIENINGGYYLKINFTFRETVKILLEIDEYTATNLINLVKFDDKNKYRLSFKSFYYDNEYLAVVSKTYKENSEILYFQCSKEYIDKLNAIKKIINLEELDKLSFISRESQPLEKKIESNYLSRINFNSGLQASAVLIGLIFVLLFIQINCFYVDKTALDNGVLAESIQTECENYENLQHEYVNYYNGYIHNIEESFYEEKLEDTKLKKKDLSSENISKSDNEIGHVELEDAVTFSLPKGKVSLTFDDAPSKYTKEIVDILKEYNVGGTFFLVGTNVEKYPEIVSYIHSNGYSIGSHSLSHYNMKNLSYEKQKSELINSIEKLKEIINDDIVLFRPPYGSYNSQLVDIATENDCKIVLWNNDPQDWKTKDADKILESIVNSNISGAIILLHESQAVIDCLPKIIEFLQEQNLEIVNLK